MAITETSRQFWAALEYIFERSEFPNQEALAITAGISQSSISMMLNKKRSFSAKVQTKVSQAFGYPLLDFLLIGRKLMAGENPDLINPSSLSMIGLDSYQSKLLGELMKRDPTLRIEFAVIDDVLFVADKDKGDFEAGKTYLVYLQGERTIRTAVEMDSKPGLATAETCKPVDAWGPPLIIGRVVLKAERVD